MTWRARVGLTLWPRPRPFLAHPAAVALLWRPPRRSALAAGATGFCAAGLSSALRGKFARALARCVPPCVLAVGALPLAFRSRERRKPPLLANCARPPAVAPCRWAFSALAAGATAPYRCFQRPKRVSHSAAAPFPACQGLIDALRPCSSPVERAHPDPPRSCARASGLHVRLLGLLSLLGASPALVVRPWFPRLVPLLVVPRSNRLLSLSLWFFPSLRWPTPPPTRPPCRVHEGGAWRACRRRLLLLSLLLRPCLLGRWPLLFFGRRGSPAGRPRAFDRHRLALLPLPSISAGRLGGERRIAPRQTLQQMPPDTTERIPRTGIRAMIPGSRREWVGRQMRLYTKFCVQKAPAQLKPHRGRARADRMGNPVRKTGAKRIKSPEMPSNCARPDQRRAKRGIPNPKRPADRPKTGCQMSSRRRSARYASVLPPLTA